MRLLVPCQRLSPRRASRWRNTTRFWKWRRTIPTFAKKFVSASVLRPNSCSSRRAGDGPFVSAAARPSAAPPCLAKRTSRDALRYLVRLGSGQPVDNDQISRRTVQPCEITFWYATDLYQPSAAAREGN